MCIMRGEKGLAVLPGSHHGNDEDDDSQEGLDRMQPHITCLNALENYQHMIKDRRDTLGNAMPLPFFKIIWHTLLNELAMWPAAF